MNLFDIFYERANDQPDHPAIIGPGTDDSLTYRELEERIEFVAARLRIAGVCSGDSIGLNYPSGREYIIFTYAIWRCGACVLPIAVELVKEEKLRICIDIHIDTVISPEKTADAFDSLRDGEVITVVDNVLAIPVLPSREHPVGFSSVNAAFLRFTSGTTAASKGVVLAHETILDRIHAANERLELTSDDRVTFLMSMSYHFAVTIVAYLSFGATIILCRNHFGRTILDETRKHEATVMYGSPVHFDMMSQVSGSDTLPKLRFAISTTTALSNKVSAAFANRFGMPLSQAFGIIEVGLPCINLNPSEKRRPSVGQVLPAYELRLEKIGENLTEIKLRGKGILDAYYEPWQPRDEIMSDGWFATGDLGEVDSDGYLFINGRSKDMISIGGMKFFPQETESVLYRHPAVREAVVLSRADERWGELPCAKVVLDDDAAKPPTEKELQEFCRLHLANFKIPDQIQFVNRLDMTASGKVLRR